MKKFILCILFFLGFIITGYAEQEFLTSEGKVILGLSPQEARRKFGLPYLAGEDIWFYNQPSEFFVYFSSPDIYLYPESVEITTGIPLELKVYASSFGGIKDISSQANFIIDRPQDFVFKKRNVIIPNYEGQYWIRAEYQGRQSNLIQVKVKKTKRKKLEKSTLLNINVFPFMPIASKGDKINFIALGTFLHPSGRYIVKDITELAEWFIGFNDRVTKTNSNYIEFDYSGSYKVFCRYMEIESLPQQVQIKEEPVIYSEGLKNIQLIPDFMLVPCDSFFEIKAWATYHDNRIEDISKKISYRIEDKEIVEKKEDNLFYASTPGITNITVSVQGIESLPAKVIVLKRGRAMGWEEFSSIYKEKSLQMRPSDLLNDFQKSVEQLEKNMFQDKKISFIRIVPDYLEVALGKEIKFNAEGVFTDGSTLDITYIGNWSSSNPFVAEVFQGKGKAYSQGSTQIYLEYQGLKSQPATLIIKPKELISIVVSPKNSKIFMGDNGFLKATGYFTDSSSEDITFEVSWQMDKKIISIKKGKVYPRWLGKTNVWAYLNNIKSLPAEVVVVFSWIWFLLMLLKMFLFLLGITLVIFLVLYLIVQKRKKKILYLLSNPQKFIITLYKNVEDILRVFGFGRQNFIPPLHYAMMIEEKYRIKDNLFTKIALIFEEAKYSQHIIKTEDAQIFLSNYNEFLKRIKLVYGKFTFFVKYCLVLCRCLPFYIY